MSADTLAARIREKEESARKYLRSHGIHFQDRATLNMPGAIYLAEILAAFALSELSAAEETARKEEREECAQIAERMNAIGADRIGDAIRNRE